MKKIRKEKMMLLIHPEQIKNQSLLIQIYFRKAPDSAEIDHFRLAERIAEKYSLTKRNSNFWNKDFMSIQIIDHEILHDTILFRWVLDSSTIEKDKWSSHRLKVIGQLSPIIKSLRTFWGITLIYQGLYSNKNQQQSVDVTQLLNTTLSLDDNANVNPRPLAEESIPGGDLWLVGIHPEGNGISSENIYLALARKSEEDKQSDYFIRQPIFSDLDIVSHKAYFERREYITKIVEKGFNQKANSLRKSTSDILNMKGISIQDSSKKIDTLAYHYDAILDDYLWLDALKISLVQLRLHLNSLRSLAPNSAIWLFHTKHIDTYTQEIKIQANNAGGLLNAAGQAVEIANSRVEKVKEKRRLRYEKLLAFFGVALAVPALISFDTIERILVEYGYSLNSLSILMIEIVITFLLASIAYLFVNRLSHHHD
jgi:hypothetical protein